MVEVQSDRAGFAEDRLNGIGGSDASAILGMHSWTTPLKLYLIKTREIDRGEPSDPEAAQVGVMIEDLIAQLYEKRTGRKTRRRNKQIVHPEIDWMRVHIDRRIDSVTDREGPGVLEAKNVSSFKAADWWDAETGEPTAPIMYQIQMQHALMVTGYKWGAFAALIGGNRLVEFDVVRDDVFIERLFKAEKEFWASVQAHGTASEAPPAARAGDDETLGSMFPADVGDRIELDDKFTAITTQLDTIAKHLTQLEKTKSELRNQIKFAIGKHEAGLLL